MGIKVANLVEEIKNRYPITDTRCISILNEAFRMICSKYSIINGTFNITFTNSASYPIPQDVTQIKAVYTSGPSPREILATSERYLDVHRPGWRTLEPCIEPSEFFVAQTATGDRSIVFVPPPSGTGGAVVYVSKTAALTSGSELPDCIPSMDFFKYYVWEKYAETSDFPNEARWAQKKQEAMAELAERLHTLAIDVQPAVEPWYVQGGGRI